MATNPDNPLVTMLDNMNFWATRADKLRDKARAMLALAEAAPEAQRKVKLAANRKVLRKLLEDSDKARQQSQRYARAAAPYVHPKLKRIAASAFDVDTSCARVQNCEGRRRKK